MVTGNTVIYRPHLFEIETAAGVQWLTRGEADLLGRILTQTIVARDEVGMGVSVRSMVKRLRRKGVPIECQNTVGYRIGNNLVVQHRSPLDALEALAAS